MKSKDGVLIDPNKEPVIASPKDWRRGDIVYLKSGGYPMTIQNVCFPAHDGAQYVNVVWHNEYGDPCRCEYDVRLLQHEDPK